MAKKPANKGSPIGYGNAVPMEFETAPMYDNNPDGPSRHPDNELYAYRHDNLYGKRICFPCNIGKGESPQRPDVNVVTPDGVSNSQGQGKNAQYNWGNDLDGHWNENTKNWDGGNLTGN